MGSIIERRRKNGGMSYLAQIVIKQGGKIVHRENRTFPARREAAGWIARREDELAAGGAPAAGSDPRLDAVITRYTTESIRQIGRTKAQVLRAINADPLAAMRCSRITSADVLAFARRLHDGGRKPQTVQNYLSHLASVFAIARPAWGYRLDQQAVRDAIAVAKRLGVTSKSRERDRRPTLEELDKLIGHFGAKRAGSNPMADIVLFALFSTRRQEEITRLAWADLDTEHGRVLVRDMKHPGEKIGNDQWLDLPPEAMAVIQRQPRTGDRIFPASTDAISASFTRACKMLGIADLHFHDLRHDGISRLFEMAWSIPHVAAVSGHRSWQSLKRYTHIRQRGDKYAGWEKSPGAPVKEAGAKGLSTLEKTI
jgi:integrase